MILIKRLIKIVPPIKGIYHTITDNNKLTMVMKYTDSSIYAPTAGTVVGYSKVKRIITITTADYQASCSIELPKISMSVLDFYVNVGERITKGLKLAEVNETTSNLMIMTFDCNQPCHYKICNS